MSEEIIKCLKCNTVLISGRGAICLFGTGTSIGCNKCGNEHVFGNSGSNQPKIKGNEQIMDEMHFVDDEGKPIKNYSLIEMIEMAKKSEFGAIWYSDKGPIEITKEGKLEPI